MFFKNGLTLREKKKSHLVFACFQDGKGQFGNSGVVVSVLLISS